jgi:hypothetical protein
MKPSNNRLLCFCSRKTGHHGDFILYLHLPHGPQYKTRRILLIILISSQNHEHDAHLTAFMPGTNRLWRRTTRQSKVILIPVIGVKKTLFARLKFIFGIILQLGDVGLKGISKIGVTSALTKRLPVQRKDKFQNSNHVRCNQIRFGIFNNQVSILRWPFLQSSVQMT